jgi:hypothetical protein
MNFVYPLGSGSRWMDNELKISVELLKKYHKNPTIYIVGEKPMQKIDGHYIRNSHNGSRYQNAISNIVAGAKAIGEPFVIMNDDFFCTKEFSEIPLWYDMTVKERMEWATSGIYCKFLQRSIENKGDLNYGVHKPMYIQDLDLFYKCASDALERDCSLRILYGNRYKIGSEKIKDIKLRKSGVISDWFSIGDVFLTEENKRWLMSLTQDTIGVSC